ncbi:unnamed protein product [Auanema sp. JU1783]|nr:unnamed protein product [Auanema sp. JU1783]
MSEPSVIQLSRAEVYVNSLSFGGSDAVAAALSTNFIHLVDLNAKKTKQTYDVAKNVVGIHFDLSGNGAVLRAVDDSFGIHLFDVRSGSKKKSRLNPIVENHLVTCSATSDNYIALASSTFLQTEPKKKKKKNDGTSSEDEDEIDEAAIPHVVSIFDIRGTTEPLITLKESHSDAVNCLAFMRDGKHLITGGSDGLINVFDVSMSNEDDALKSTNQAESSVAKVCSLSKRLFYGCTDDNKCVVYSPNSPEDVDLLFKKSARPDHFLVDLLKGGQEERPIAMIECEESGKVSLSTVSVDGKHSEIIEEWSGHTDIVRSTAYNNGLLVTGGEDGKIVAKQIDLRTSGGGKSKKEKKSKHKSF